MVDLGESVVKRAGVLFLGGTMGRRRRHSTGGDGGGGGDGEAPKTPSTTKAAKRGRAKAPKTEPRPPRRPSAGSDGAEGECGGDPKPAKRTRRGSKDVSTPTGRSTKSSKAARRSSAKRSESKKVDRAIDFLGMRLVATRMPFTGGYRDGAAGSGEAGCGPVAAKVMKDNDRQVLVVHDSHLKQGVLMRFFGMRSAGLQLDVPADDAASHVVRVESGSRASETAGEVFFSILTFRDAAHAKKAATAKTRQAFAAGLSIKGALCCEPVACIRATTADSTSPLAHLPCHRFIGAVL